MKNKIFLVLAFLFLLATLYTQIASLEETPLFHSLSYVPYGLSVPISAVWIVGAIALYSLIAGFILGFQSSIEKMSKVWLCVYFFVTPFLFCILAMLNVPWTTSHILICLVAGMEGFGISTMSWLAVLFIRSKNDNKVLI